jgi:hypothetical protein
MDQRLRQPACSTVRRSIGSRNVILELESYRLKHFARFFQACLSARACNAVTLVVSDVDPSFIGVGMFEVLVEMAPHPVGTES